MKTARQRNSSGPAPSGELAELRARLVETEETLRAIRNGEVDAVMATGKQGPQVFTLVGAEHAYRVLIESMNEGALTLTADKMILYVRLPADTELTLYRVLQEALKNVEKHAGARHVTVRLTKQGDIVQLTIKDDGIGFDPDHHPTNRNAKSGLGLLSMRERATYVGGDLKVRSVRRASLRRAGALAQPAASGYGPAKAGTEIAVRIPLPPGATAAKLTN